jgi:uncharacterized protein (TIGR03437 family)
LFHLIASQGQIDLLVPAELPTSNTAAVRLNTPSGPSADYTVAMAPVDPAIYFLADPSQLGRDNALAQFNNTNWLAMTASMAAALGIPGNCHAGNVNPNTLCGEAGAWGEYLVLYTTGLGKATPNGNPNGAPLKSGEVAPADGSVLYQTIVTPFVRVAGLDAKVLFAGIVPGYSGLYQIDFQVPQGVTGGKVPVEVFSAGPNSPVLIPPSINGDSPAISITRAR